MAYALGNYPAALGSKKPYAYEALVRLSLSETDAGTYPNALFGILDVVDEFTNVLVETRKEDVY